METDKNVITGKLFVFNGEYPFTFENNVLHISVDVSNKEVVPLSSGNFKESILAGVFENDSKFISFYIADNRYRTGFRAKYVAQTTIAIPVKFYLIHSRPIGSESFSSIKIQLENNKFRKFLNFSEEHILPTRFRKTASINCKTRYNTNSIKKETKFSFGNVRIKMVPQFKLTYNYSEIIVHSCLDFVIAKKKIDFEFLDKMFNMIYHLLQFIFYRQNIEFGSINLFVKRKINGEYLFEPFGEIFLPINNRFEMEDSDLNSLVDYGFIPWLTIAPYIPNIVSLLEKEELYLYNLPINKKEKGYTSINSVSLDASAFEFEFGKLYKKVELFDDVAIRKEAIKEIEQFASTIGDPNRHAIILNCTNNIMTPTLGMKNRRALKDFEFIIKPIADKFGYNNYVDEISKEFVEKRNFVNHGSKNTKIEPSTANAYYLERILILSMQLKRIGMPNNDIIKNIKYIFELFI